MSNFHCFHHQGIIKKILTLDSGYISRGYSAFSECNNSRGYSACSECRNLGSVPMVPQALLGGVPRNIGCSPTLPKQKQANK